MGIYMPFGVIAAMALTLVLVPFFYSFGGRHGDRVKKRGTPAGKKGPMDGLLDRIYRLNTDRPKTIVALFMGIFIFSAGGAARVETESNMARSLSEKIAIRQAIDHVDARMGGSMSLEIMLDTGRAGWVKEGDFLRKMERLEAYVADHPLTTDTTSLLTVLKKMRRAFHRNDPAYYCLPQTTAAVSQYLLMDEMSGGDQMDKIVGFKYDISRLNAKTRSLDTKETRHLMADIITRAERIFGDTVQVSCIGTLILSAGFAVLILSNMNGWVRIGALSGFAFIWALSADLMLAPALILLTKPLGAETKKVAPTYGHPPKITEASIEYKEAG